MLIKEYLVLAECVCAVRAGLVTRHAAGRVCRAKICASGQERVTQIRVVVHGRGNVLARGEVPRTVQQQEATSKTSPLSNLTLTSCCHVRRARVIVGRVSVRVRSVECSRNACGAQAPSPVMLLRLFPADNARMLPTLKW